MVNDILWLHRPYYTADGVYTEGVSMYSFMSIAGLVETAVVQVRQLGSLEPGRASLITNTRIRMH